VRDLITGFQDGGPFMWPILVLGVFAVAIGFERLVLVLFRANLNATAFVAEIQKLVLADRLDQAIALCHGQPNAALARVIGAGLVRASLSERELEAGVEEAMLEVAPVLTRRTAYLGTIANVATLTGLLGTIQGLIQAFDAVASAPPELKQARLAAGIAVAMHTTFFGLLVAVPTLLVQSVVLGTTHRILDEVERYAVRIVSLLVARQRGAAQRTA
jgi:biopolymer transport protein ExbB/TolQ